MPVPSPLAHAGLQDCIDADMDCMPGFGWFLVGFGAVIVGGVVYLSIALWATVSIIDAHTGIARGIGWVIGVWGLPFIGVAAWCVALRRMGAPPESADSHG